LFKTRDFETDPDSDALKTPEAKIAGDKTSSALKHFPFFYNFFKKKM